MAEGWLDVGAMLMLQVKRVLVIEDDVAVRGAIVQAARGWDAEVLEADSVAGALEKLTKGPDLIIVDVRLPDGSALSLVEAAVRRAPAPTVVALSGVASPEEAFRLAQAGVRAYLAKPFSLQSLERTVEQAMGRAPSLEPLVVACVGHTPMLELQGSVRRAMVDQALAMTHGSRSGAARLLKVSRQAVQQIVRGREREDDLPASDRS